MHPAKIQISLYERFWSDCAFAMRSLDSQGSKVSSCALRKHAYSNTMYIENFTTKNWKFSDKNSDIVHISAQYIDCG